MIFILQLHSDSSVCGRIEKIPGEAKLKYNPISIRITCQYKLFFEDFIRNRDNYSLPSYFRFWNTHETEMPYYRYSSSLPKTSKDLWRKRYTLTSRFSFYFNLRKSILWILWLHFYDLPFSFLDRGSYNEKKMCNQLIPVRWSLAK